MLATPNPLPAEQAESVSSDKRGHQQLGGRTTWWSALAKLAANLLLVPHKQLPTDMAAQEALLSSVDRQLPPEAQQECEGPSEGIT